jgi:hypothetical protein
LLPCGYQSGLLTSTPAITITLRSPSRSQLA